MTQASPAVLTFTRGLPRNQQITTHVRWDDQCRNGYKTFSITGEIALLTRLDDPHTSGCIHEEIAEHFPKLQHMLKWHLMSETGPMHYMVNTLYHAGDGNEGKQRVGRKGPMWFCTNPADHHRLHCGERPADEVITLTWEPVRDEGKERNLPAARECALWPEATDAQLLLPPAELEALLLARLPGLMAEFRRDIEALGFEF